MPRISPQCSNAWNNLLPVPSPLPSLRNPSSGARNKCFLDRLTDAPPIPPPPEGWTPCRPRPCGRRRVGPFSSGPAPSSSWSGGRWKACEGKDPLQPSRSLCCSCGSCACVHLGRPPELPISPYRSVAARPRSPPPPPRRPPTPRPRPVSSARGSALVRICRSLHAGATVKSLVFYPELCSIRTSKPLTVNQQKFFETQLNFKFITDHGMARFAVSF